MIVLSGDKYTKEKTNKWLLNTCFFKKIGCKPIQKRFTAYKYQILEIFT